MKNKKEIKRNKKKSHAARYVITVILAVICIVGVGYSYTVCAYRSQFSEGTTINGIDVGGLTVDEAKAKLAEQEVGYVVTLKFRDNQSEEVSGEDIDFHYSDEYNVQEILDSQNNRNIVDTILNRQTEYSLTADYSKSKLVKKLMQLPEMKSKNMIAPVDAHPVYSDGTFTIEPETLGTTLDKKTASTALGEIVKNGELVLEMEDIYETPSVYADDETLTKQIDKLNEMVGTSVTYILPNGKKQVLDGSTLVKWLVKNKKGIYKKDKAVWNENLTAYVHELAQSVETVWNTHKFHTTAGTDIDLPGTGYYGWQIDEEKEVAQLTEDLESKKAEKREPIYSKREATDYSDNYGFGNTYCEIDLGKQHLWIYKNGKMVFQTDVVSGKNDDKHRTPAGAFTAYDKQKNKMMRGDRLPNGKYEYETLAKYWIRLNNQGVGLHDAPWRSRFGGTIWKTGGSHGCVNLPAAAAVQIYDLIDNGTPVAVYY